MGEYECDSPSAVTYVDSPTNFSDYTADASSSKRQPLPGRHNLNAMFRADSQDLSGFSGMDSPSAVETFFPAQQKRNDFRNLQTSTTEELEADWESARLSARKNEFML